MWKYSNVIFIGLRPLTDNICLDSVSISVNGRIQNKAKTSITHLSEHIQRFVMPELSSAVLYVSFWSLKL